MSILTIADVRARCTIVEATRCWLWQGALSTDGVPRIHTIDYGRAEKRAMSGPLAVWHIAHNHPPLPGHLVYRACQNRLCLNPVHLREAASKAAIGEHIRRLGSRKGTCTAVRLANLRLAQIANGSRATPDEVVLAIAAVPRADATNLALAQRFDVDVQTVSRIRRGESYRHLTAGTPAT